jgi:CBS domain-containing protein
MQSSKSKPMAPEKSLLVDSSYTLPVKQLIKRAPIFVAADATVAEAAQAMQAARVGSALIATEPPGIVTDRDLRGRVLAARLSAETAVSRVMTRPLKTVDSDAPTLAALRLMLEENIHHLPLTEEGKIVGVISASDLLFLQGKSPVYLRGFIDALDDPAKARDYAREIGELVRSLFHSGLAAIHISQIVSTLNDALVKRLVALAVMKLGAPPVPFAWIVFGSEGRMEQTLLTDQDNALVYAADSARAHDYFSALAEAVVRGLIQAGFPLCPGGFMATRWCKSLAGWQELFERWIRLPEPQALLDAAIFFDFRSVAGDLPLSSLDEIIAAARSQNLFLCHLARGALDFSPPLGFFNRLRSENGAIDLKKCAVAPIVGLARAAALAAGSHARSTLERLAAIKNSQGLLSGEDAAALAEIFPALFQLRLQHQLQQLAAGVTIDHGVKLAELSSLTRRQLKDAFIAIKRIQDGARVAWRLDRLG